MATTPRVWGVERLDVERPRPEPEVEPQPVRNVAVLDDVRRLQRTAGNRAVTQMLSQAQRPRLQRMSLGEARATVAAEKEYREKTALLETRLGPHLSGKGEVQAIANELLGRLKKVVDAWADATKQDKTLVYGTEFSFPGAQIYYGSFRTTGENIKAVFDDIAKQPLRTKLNVVYYSLRGNAFAKFLEAAALELQGKGSAVDFEEGSAKTPRTMQPGFAKASGLEDVWKAQDASKLTEGQYTPEQMAKIVEKRTKAGDKPNLGVKSDVLSSQDPVVKSRDDKVYNKAEGLTWEDQLTLTKAEVPDITGPELALLEELETGTAPPKSDWASKQQAWASKGTEKVRWEMGVASIDVKPGSNTREIAERFRARLDAGISGSTDLMMHAGVHLGLSSPEDKKKLRLALVAWMLSNRDHSFYEIMTAAAGYGVPFAISEAKPGGEYEDPANFEPLTASDVQNFKTLMPNQLMPSHYLSQGHVKSLEAPVTAPQTGSAPQPSADDLLQALGVSSTELVNCESSLFVANHEALTAAVAGTWGGNASEQDLRQNRVRYQALRESPSFQWLALHHSGKATYVEKELEKLVNQVAPNALVTADQLKADGVPDTLADAAPPIQRLDLARLVLVVGLPTSTAPLPQPDDVKKGLPYLAVKRFGDKVAEDTLTALMGRAQTIGKRVII